MSIELFIPENAKEILDDVINDIKVVRKLDIDYNLWYEELWSLEVYKHYEKHIISLALLPFQWCDKDPFLLGWHGSEYQIRLSSDLDSQYSIISPFQYSIRSLR